MVVCRAIASYRGGSRGVVLGVVLCALLGAPPRARATDGTDALLQEYETDAATAPAGFPDPLEPVNRGTFWVNNSLDRALFDPLTRVYRFITPNAFREAVQRFLLNLNSPAVLANDLLQGQWRGAGTTTERFLINTTVGLAGFFDPAGCWGIERHHADFGQTLARWGVPSGPYLMIPILGPTTARDGLGDVVGLAFRPTTYILVGTELLYYTAIHGSSSGLTEREQHADDLRRLKESSVDYYAALRNAYYQARMAQIAGTVPVPRPHPTTAADVVAPAD